MNTTRQVFTTVPVQLQRSCACGGTCERCRKKKAEVQHSALAGPGRGQAGGERGLAGSGRGLAPPIVHDVLRSPGRPLDPATRSNLESRLGHDFSKVRIHTSERAANSAEAVDAAAYTVGRNIVFGPGRYAPGTTAGRQLLAHELVHTVQQRGAAEVPSRLIVNQPSGGDEREANHHASPGPSRGGAPAQAVRSLPGTILQRQASGKPRKFHTVDEELLHVLLKKPTGKAEKAAWMSRLEALFRGTPASRAKKLARRLKPGSKGDTLAKVFAAKLGPGDRARFLSILKAKSPSKKNPSKKNPAKKKSSPKKAATAGPKPNLAQQGKPALSAGKPVNRSACSVEVHATGVGGAASLAGAKHLFIVHRDERGVRTAYRAGPTLPSPLFGHLSEAHGKYNSGFPDWDPKAPSVTVLSGKKACEKDDCIVSKFIAIDKKKLPYDPLIRNSNTVVRVVLERCGLPQLKPNVWAPAWSRDLNYKPVSMDIFGRDSAMPSEPLPVPD